MNILATSDLHGQLADIPKYIKASDIDILICAGDMEPTNVANMSINSDYFEQAGFRTINKSLEIMDQDKWIEDKFWAWDGKINAEHLIYVNGNHTFTDATKHFDLGCGFKPRTIKVKDLKVGLLPGSMPFTGEWSDEQPEEVMAERILKIDKDIDILVSHVPVHGILDRTHGGDRIGCRSLTKSIFGSNFDKNGPYFTKLSHCFFGHCHEARGDEEQEVLGRKIKFYNCSERLVEVEL